MYAKSQIWTIFPVMLYFVFEIMLPSKESRTRYKYGGIKEYEVCENSSEYLFFDSFHPNEVASRQFAEIFWNGDSKITEPYDLKAFFEGTHLTFTKKKDN